MSDWISVDERLPDYDVDVQIYCADTKEQMVGYRSRDLNNNKRFQYAFYMLTTICCDPTHWMPLPPPPPADTLGQL